MKTRHVEISGGRRLHIREIGTGPAMLLLHGIPTNGELWREVAPRLAGRARVIVPDLLGYGQSDAPAGAHFGIEAQAGYMLELLDALDIERTTVVGHDIGGGVAQILAVRHSERVERLGLVNAVCYDSWPVPEMKLIQKAAGVVEHLPAGLTTEGIELGLRRGFTHKDRADTFLNAFLEPFATAEGLHVFVEHARALHSGPTEEVAAAFPTLRIPVVIAWGEQDPFLKLHWGERLASDIPTAELVRIPDASHFSPAEAPGEVAAALERLLDRPVA